MDSDINLKPKTPISLVEFPAYYNLRLLVLSI